LNQWPSGPRAPKRVYMVLTVIETVTFGVIILMLLLVYRSIVTVFIVLAMVGLGLMATRGMVACLGYHDLIG